MTPTTREHAKERRNDFICLVQSNGESAQQFLQHFPIDITRMFFNAGMERGPYRAVLKPMFARIGAGAQP